MLVCNVSLRPRRSAIAAELAEAGTALDVLGTGNVVFATLVDDPASVNEIVDAYLGEIMREAASASDTTDASVPAVYTADVNEAATAAETQSGSTAIPSITWDATTAASVTLSGGNLIVTSTTNVTGQGIKLATANAKTTGKYYFEITLTTITGAGGDTGLGIGTTASGYAALGSNATTGNIMYPVGGNIYAGGSNSGISLGARASGNVIGVAADLDNRKIWFRVAPSGNWNNSGTANPATNTGGITVPAGTMVAVNVFDIINHVYTANFGGTAFTGAVPSGFTSGWPP